MTTDAYGDCGSTIWNRFRAVVAPAFPDDLLFFGEDAPDASVDETYWILTVLEGQSFQISVSPQVFRRPGIVVMQIGLPRASGPKALDDRKDAARTVFEGQELTMAGGQVIIFQGAEPVPAGGDSRFAQHNVNVAFHYDDPN